MKRETVLVLQGGGALGAFQCGVYMALEERGIIPDLIAGVSIGAVNAAIIAGSPRGRAAPALEAFWSEIAVPDPPVSPEALRRLLAAWQIALFGVPKFFIPRWLAPSWQALRPFPWLTWTSLYDPTPLKKTIEKYVDFGRLASGETRLILTAVNVETGGQEVFDSAEQRIGVEHIVASGSFPPGLPWTVIDGKAYWDGGLVTNTPLQPVMERRAGVPLRIYVVNLFPKAQPLPRNLLGVVSRQKDILYADKTECDLRNCELRDETLALVQELMEHVDPKVAGQIRQSGRYRGLVEQTCRVEIIRFAHHGEAFESESKDYDFSRGTVRQHIRHGYEHARAILAQEAAQSEKEASLVSDRREEGT
ncbi:MAG: patatin-like phospholipase family protein [candidate division NC10 bacterium]|nr:patatin-like phospholipase family protein [candidate division NC10 bacterium]